MTPDQRETELRRRVVAFRALSQCERVGLPPAVYGHLADCAFLLDLVDGLRTAIAHTPTRATRVMYLLPPKTVLPAAPAIAPPRTPWDDPFNQG